MKLIDKLAEQYYQDRPQGFGEPREDFRAGFLACREMAISLELEGSDPRYIKESLEELGEDEE